MLKKILGLIVLYCVASSVIAVETPVGDRPLPQKGVPSVKEQVIIVPSETVIPALTTYELNTSNLLTGQTVTVILPVDFYYKENLIAPKGSTVTGNVIEASKARQNGVDGRLSIRFTLLTTPYGFQMPIAGVIKTKDFSGVLVGEDKALSSDSELDSKVKENEEDNIVENKEEKSEIDFIKAVWNFGQNVVIPADKTVEILLTQPITANPTVYTLN